MPMCCTYPTNWNLSDNPDYNIILFQSHTCCVCIAQFFNRAVNSLCGFLFPCQGPITLITDNLPANFPGFPIDRRAQVALELYTTERSYVRSLETILQVWIDELITVRVCKNAKFGVFYAEIVQMTPLRLRRESLQLQKFSVTNREPLRLQKFSVTNTVLSLPFSQQIQFMLL